MIEYDIRGHHLMNFKLYLLNKNNNSFQKEYFSKLLSNSSNLIRIINSNDFICDKCKYSLLDYCSDGVNIMDKKIVAARDIEKANCFKISIGNKVPILKLIESVLSQSYLYIMKINAEDFLLHNSLLPL
jgi:hypothetical protein